MSSRAKLRDPSRLFPTNAALKYAPDPLALNKMPNKFSIFAGLAPHLTPALCPVDLADIQSRHHHNPQEQHTVGKLPYSADEIAGRLGTTTGVFFGEETPLGAREIAAVRAAGISRIEVCGIGSPRHFDYGNPQQAEDVVRECREQGVEIVSTHGPSVEYAATDEDERAAAVKEAAAAARVAESMGASVMVCHFGVSEESKRTIVDMLEELEGSSIKLANENGVDLRDYMAVVDEVGWG